MGTRRSQVVTGFGPPSVCVECRASFRSAVVTCGSGKRKGSALKSLCPRCTRTSKLAKRRQKKRD